MTFTPLDAALASMAAPLPESRASTNSTVAPAVMSASAWVCMVLALPCALSILNWLADSPAAWNALVRYGASKDTYRADVVVSGSSTPTIPLPWAARPFSCASAEKSAVNDEADIDTAAVVLVVLPAPADVFVFEEPQALRPPTTSTATDSRTAPGNDRFMGASLVSRLRGTVHLLVRKRSCGGPWRVGRAQREMPASARPKGTSARLRRCRPNRPARS